MASSPPGGHPCPKSLRESISDALMLLAAASRSNKETALPSKDRFSRHRHSTIPFDDSGIVEKMKSSFTTYRFRVFAKGTDTRHYSGIKVPQAVSTVEISPLNYLPFRMSWLEPRPAPKPPQRGTNRQLGRAPSRGRSKSCGPPTVQHLHAPQNAGRNKETAEHQPPKLSYASNRKLTKRPPLPPPSIVRETAPARPSTRPHPLFVASKRSLPTFRSPLDNPGNTVPITEKPTLRHPEQAAQPGPPSQPDTPEAGTERSKVAPSQPELEGDGDLSERSWLWLDATPVTSPVASSFVEDTLPKTSSALLSLPEALLLQISSYLSPSSAAALSRTHPALRHLTTSVHHLLSVLPRSRRRSIEETVTKMNGLIAANAGSYISAESLPFLTSALQELYAFTHVFTPSSPISAQMHHFRSRRLSPQLLKAVLESFQALGALLAPLTSPGSLPLALAAGAVKDLGNSRRREMEEALEEWGLHAQSCSLFKLVAVMAEPEESKRWERVKEQGLGKWERGKLADGRGYLKSAVRALLVEEQRT